MNLEVTHWPPFHVVGYIIGASAGVLVTLLVLFINKSMDIQNDHEKRISRLEKLNAK